MPTDQVREDKEAILEVINRYHHMCDGPEVTKLGEIYTQDAVVDGREFGLGVAEGLDAIIDVFNQDVPKTVIAHVGGNPVIEVDGDEARCVSKAVGFLENGAVGVAIHNDRLRRTPAGWRVYERRVTKNPRRPG